MSRLLSGGRSASERVKRMGLFYSNLTVYHPVRPALLTEMRKFEREAFLSPTIQGHTVVFDKAMDDQDSNAIEGLGKAVTKALSCSALAAVLHDDDVLYLWLFQNGRVHDRYDSCPAYFDPHSEPRPPEGGNAKLLCKAFDRLDRVSRVYQLLRADLLEGELPDVPGEFERHAALAAELGMPPFVAGVCYSSIAGDYVPKAFIPPAFEGIRFEEV
jgi:hypothetical protein